MSPAPTRATDPADRDWALFCDWCEATGRDATAPAGRAALGAADLLEFARQIPCAPSTLRRRLRAITSALDWAAPARGAEQHPAAPAWRTGPEWLPLGGSLLRCPPGGFPMGFRGRRDAWLLVLMAPGDQGGLGMTRDQARAVMPRHVRTAAGQVALRSPQSGGLWRSVASDLSRSPEACPACACLRWLHAAGLASRWGRSGAREHLLTSRRPEAHECGADGSGALAVDRGWREAWTLAPAIDQHGWPTDWRPMSARAVSDVLTARCDRLVPLPEPDGAEEWEPTSTRHADLALDDLFSTLDDVADSADEVNARIRAILDETDGMLGSLSQPKK